MSPNLVNKLRKEKEKSNHHQHKLSAVLLYKGRPISFGFNDKFRTHPKIKQYSEVKTVHAEMAALLKIQHQPELISECVMVVYREDRFGQPANSKSCPVCVAMMKDFGIKTVIYSTKDGFVEERL